MTRLKAVHAATDTDEPPKAQVVRLVPRTGRAADNKLRIAGSPDAASPTTATDPTSINNTNRVLRPSCRAGGFGDPL